MQKRTNQFQPQMFANICSLLNCRSVQSAFGTWAVVAAWHIRDTSDASVYSLYTDSYTDRLMPWYIDTIQRAHGGGIQSAIEDQQNEQSLVKLPFWPDIILCFEVNEPKQLFLPFLKKMFADESILLANIYWPPTPAFVNIFLLPFVVCFGKVQS